MDIFFVLESNNPLSVGGTGSAPICIEQLEYSNYNSNYSFSFNLSLNEKYNYTSIRINLSEEFVSSSYFEIETSNTPTAFLTLSCSTLIPALAVPVALIGTLAFMQVMGFSRPD